MAGTSPSNEGGACSTPGLGSWDTTCLEVEKPEDETGTVLQYIQ